MQNSSTLLLVSAVALIDDACRVLMQKRRFGSVHGGLWEFPGGKLERSEAPETALCREIEEELGLHIEPGSLEAVTFSSGDHAPGTHLVIFLYMSRVWSGEPLCLDAEEVAWFAPSQLAELAMPPLDYPLAEALVRNLSQASRT